MERIASARSPVLDHVLPAVGEAANHSVLWLAIALGMAATGNKRSRRAALRGVAGIAIAGTVANVVAKGLTGRARPTGEIPVLRRLIDVPKTTSFPSGHSASAAAFATGVALELPRLAVPVGAVAFLVGASRVATGVHYPSDVVAGFSLGAAAGSLTLRWWPLRPSKPADATRPWREAPAAPTGEGVVLAVNESAGSASPQLTELLREQLPDAEIIEMAEGDDLGELLRGAARRAKIIGVAGGDGTLNVAADVAQDTDLPLLVIPAGTFNHFSADLGVTSAQDALAALRAGEAVCVDVGVAGQQPFLNTSSTGVYADLVEARERLEDRIGKWPALMVALVHVLRHSRPQDVFVNGRRRRLWLLFAGNCCYAPQGFALVPAESRRRPARRAGGRRQTPVRQAPPARRGADRHARPQPRLPDLDRAYRRDRHRRRQSHPGVCGWRGNRIRRLDPAGEAPRAAARLPARRALVIPAVHSQQSLTDVT